jgi:hypothetical protein
VPVLVRPPDHPTTPARAPRVCIDESVHGTETRIAPFPSPGGEQTAAPIGWQLCDRRWGELLIKASFMEYTLTAAFLLAVVAGSFAAVIIGGKGIVQLIAFAL